MYRSAYYKQLVSLWFLFFMVSFYVTARLLIDAVTINGNLFFLTLFLIAVIHFFILNFLKDIGFFYFTKRLEYPLIKKKTNKRNPSVEIVYYTKNNFNANVINESLNQTHKNVSFTILDASTKPQVKGRISSLMKRTKGITRISIDPKQKKETAVNEYLKKSKAVYIVILGSDCIISRNYIEKALSYFSVKRVLAVQPHKIVISTRNEFVKTFASGRIGSTQLYQKVRQTYGFLPISPSGSIFRREALLAVGGIGSLESEDIELSLRMKKRRYITRYGEDLDCRVTENLSGWSKKQILVLLVNLRNIYNAKIERHEKMDLFLFLHNFSLKSMAIMYYLLYLTMHFIMHYSLHYSLRMEVSYLLLLALPLGLYAYISFIIHQKRVMRLTRKILRFLPEPLRGIRLYYRFSIK